VKENRRIVFFDGVCNLCNSSVQRIIRNDPKGNFYFASLQSDFAKDFLATRIPAADSSLGTIIYHDSNGNLHQRSGAVLRLTALMKFPYPLLYFFLIVPPFIRNAIYNWVAKNRYKWYGKRDQCMIPDQKLKARFIE